MVRKFYTHQKKEFLEEALRTGFFKSSLEFVDNCFKEPFVWLFDKYKELHSSNEDYSLIWLWQDSPPKFYFEDYDDMDNLVESSIYKDIFKNGDVFIEFELPEEKVLISSYNSWHTPLNHMALLSEDEELLESNGEEFPTNYGWSRVLDLKWLLDSGYETESSMILQGVIDIVPTSAITKIIETPEAFKLYFYKNFKNSD